jgi:hypothetical protein
MRDRLVAETVAGFEPFIPAIEKVADLHLKPDGHRDRLWFILQVDK